ncbi:DUF2784 domain-containing protein [Allohahella marinimesophila]|uniref:DUF2784 domain-containing protein n=1 Tax=Allohahella marinimesophila TaxID=1054972 RepID=A0ABP7PHC8_9GAMM
MISKALYAYAADAMLLLHVLFVAFVVIGLVLIFIGKFMSWPWVRNLWFRGAHLAGIGIVVIQAWLGVICPLTVWEMQLRAKAGEYSYEGSFIAHWLSELLYYQAPAWVFIACYTIFGVLVVLSWWLVPPRKRSDAPQARA